jgi:sulfur transfer protein SufE
MEPVAEYRRRAEETERFTECVLWEEQRRLILELARTWRTMADQRELLLKRAPLDAQSD